ncbi:MAG TPA: discoidin domain-containing protein [Chitinophaga sp.]|uniref:discoidin domain-containing protein n=1 Tax=Chitinophaga sp. TaxID=1869181 RepID=UPI002C418831|nr:discoidin domain-containing protein [Chitinophaga sp.]HVI44451.1 discoidin domain-containing protein [Chitinophaga sp.]
MYRKLLLIILLSIGGMGCNKEMVKETVAPDPKNTAKRSLTERSLTAGVIGSSATYDSILWKVDTVKNENAYKFDQMAGIDRYQGQLYILGGNCASWDGEYNLWELWKGANVNNAVKQLQQPKPAANFPYYTTEGNDDWCNYWLMGLWIDPSDGKFYSIAYSEYNYMKKWETEAKERRMGLATSVDNGQTWTYQGDIITQDKSIPPPPGQKYYGAGDLDLFIPGDGYAYVYYKKGFYSDNSGHRTEQDICVARCRLSDKLAPGYWKKFYNGSWVEAGIGGHETIIIPDVNIANVCYNKFLKKYVCIGNDTDGKTFISFANSMPTQDWSPRDFGFPQISWWYNWFVNVTNNNQHVMGQSFKLYTAGLNLVTKARHGYDYHIVFDMKEYDRTGWEVIDFSSQEPWPSAPEEGGAAYVLDNNPYTFWSTAGVNGEAPFPHHITIDTKSAKSLHGITFKNRKFDIDYSSGQPKDMQVLVSEDNVNWQTAATYTNIEIPEGPVDESKTRLSFPAAVNARYLKLVVTAIHGTNKVLYFSEIGAF